jgi:hypothetical protein
LEVKNIFQCMNDLGKLEEAIGNGLRYIETLGFPLTTQMHDCWCVQAAKINEIQGFLLLEFEPRVDFGDSNGFKPRLP